MVIISFNNCPLLKLCREMPWFPRKPVAGQKKRMLSRHPRYDLISQQGVYEPLLIPPMNALHALKRMPWGVTGSLVNLRLIEKVVAGKF